MRVLAAVVVCLSPFVASAQYPNYPEIRVTVTVPPPTYIVRPAAPMPKVVPVGYAVPVYSTTVIVRERWRPWWRR